MKFYFSTRNIPGMQQLPLTQRVQLLQQASNKMTLPEKMLLNLIKLAILVPAFILIFRASDSWSALLWAGLIFLLYPLVLKPLQNSISAKYLKQEDDS